MLGVALNAHRLAGRTQAISSNLLAAFAKLALIFVCCARCGEFFESVNVLAVALACVSTATHWNRRKVVLTEQCTVLAKSFSGGRSLLRCMNIKYVLRNRQSEVQ